jgi:surface antigen
VLNQKQKIKSNMVRIKFLVFTLVMSALLATATLVGGRVYADQFDNQINALRAQNAANQAQSDSLAAVAASYQQAIDALNQRIASLQSAIDATQAKIDDLNNQIAQAQAELDHEKQVLGENIKTMYLEGDVTTLEVLASSNNLSDFVNKQEYRNSVADKIKASVDKINALKAELTKQQEEQQNLLKDQQTQQKELQDSQAQQTAMLNYTEGQKAAYDAQIAAANSQISQLRAQQAAYYAAYARRGGIAGYGVGEAGNGGYPSEWAFATQDTILDNWGMHNRECVSYVAWKIASTGRYMPGWGWASQGNAAQWPGAAAASGIPQGSAPRVGSAVVWGSGAGLGPLGHVAYVEVVNGDGSIEVSQYNFVHGQFSRMHVDAGIAASLDYIYF